METKELTCKYCKAPMEYIEDRSVFRCTHCQREEYLEEPEAVIIERIRAKAEKERAARVERREEAAREQAKNELLKENREKRIKTRIALCATGLAIIVLVVICIRIFGNTARIPQDAHYYTGRLYTEVYQMISDAGFKNIVPEEIQDLTMAEANREQLVVQVTIGGEANFAAKRRYKRDLLIRVTYHTIDPERADDLRIPVSSSECIGKGYRDIAELFREAGFVVEEHEDASLINGQHLRRHTIKEITVNKNPSFDADEWVADGATVEITYLELREDFKEILNIPRSYSDCINVEYRIIANQFEDAQFVITENRIEDLGKDQADRFNIITEITVNGSTSFERGAEVRYDAEIIITYHALNPERANDIRAGNSADYNDLEIKDVTKRLVDAGFKNVNLIPKITNRRKDINRIKEIQINGRNTFIEEEWFAPDSRIEIEYWSEKWKYDNAVFRDVESELKALGFTQVILVPLEDEQEESKLTGKVVHVLVDDQELSEVTELNLNVPIYVHYHSRKELTTSRVELKKTNADLKNKPVQEVKDELENMGFLNVSTKPVSDASTLLIKKGNVVSVSIGGENDFKEGYIYESDVPVVVYYKSKE